MYGKKKKSGMQNIFRTLKVKNTVAHKNPLSKPYRILLCLGNWPNWCSRNSVMSWTGMALWLHWDILLPEKVWYQNCMLPVLGRKMQENQWPVQHHPGLLTSSRFSRATESDSVKITITINKQTTKAEKERKCISQGINYKSYLYQLQERQTALFQAERWWRATHREAVRMHKPLRVGMLKLAFTLQFSYPPRW